MESEDITRLRLNLPNIEIELTGEREFVEELYQLVSRDLLPVYESRPRAVTPRPYSPKKRDMGPPHHRFTWIYACTDLFHKVYVVDNDAVERSILGKWIEPKWIRRLYIKRENEKLLSSISGGNKTLWAEFTDAGKQFLRSSGFKGVKNHKPGNTETH